MRKLFSDKVLESKILDKYAYTIIYEAESDSNIAKIFDKNKNLNLSRQNDFFFNVVGCSSTIHLPKYYDILFDIENLEIYTDVQCKIKEVFALGFMPIGEIPAKWNVSALIHFQDNIPLHLINPISKYCLSSREFWQEILNCV